MQKRTESSQKAISIHAPHTGRDLRLCWIADDVIISIHAPHTGRDVRRYRLGSVSAVFQSTRPIRGATLTEAANETAKVDFNPRAPYGARPVGAYSAAMREAFQSTRPIRGATLQECMDECPAGFQSTRPIRGATVDLIRAPAAQPISIHAPHTGRDSKSSGGQINRDGFQSTRPIRGATQGGYGSFGPEAISIHAPHTGRDRVWLSSQGPC